MTENHPPSGLRYVGAIIALLVLTAISYTLANAGIGAAELPVALGIAVVKATIVAVVFMHLGTTPGSPRMIPVITVLFILLLSAGIVADVATR